MLTYKLRTGGHLVGCLLWGSASSAVYGFARGPRSGLAAIGRAMLIFFKALGAIVRLKGKYRVTRLVELCQESGVQHSVLIRNPEAAYTLAEKLNHAQKFEAAIEVVDPHVMLDPFAAKLLAMRGFAHLGLGHYPNALADFNRAAELRPALARDMYFDLYRSYLFGLRGDLQAARKAMAAQMLEPGDASPPEMGLASFLFKRLSPHLKVLNLKGSIGVVIGNFHAAVGHAILDPFHFIQLFRDRFDHLILVHPPYGSYTPATRISAFILDQYVEQIEISDLHSLNFAWQSLGELRHEHVTFLVHHYWSLNRLAFQARQDSEHRMSHGRDYLAMPPKLATRAEMILRRNGFDLAKPLVVVHTREHGYHALHGQRYRNTDIRNYIPALQRLIDLGYQVVRIGDRKMTSVRRDVPGLVELPGTEYYDQILDPYLISRCRFTISCQSGPCSYARVFGKPNLVINAVYHYTLLPEQHELIGFKHYLDAKTNEPLDLDQIFEAGAHLFDRTEHFEEAGIEVEDMTPEEILTATNEMIEWLDNPAKPETENQLRFRERMNWFSAHQDKEHPLSHPMNDYIGYSLPECRVSDSMCEQRPGFLPSVRQDRLAA